MRQVLSCEYSRIWLKQVKCNIAFFLCRERREGEGEGEEEVEVAS
jgi:hypothetical protein